MNVLAIALTDLKRFLRERVALFWIFVGPLLFASFFGVLFQAQPRKATTIELVNHDASDYLARVLTLVLAERDKIEVKPVAAVTPDRWALEIPPGAAEALAAGEPVKLVLRSPDTDETDAERRLRFRITKALVTAYLQANPGDVPADVDVEVLRRRLLQAQAIAIRRADIGIEQREVTAGFQRTVASYLVMFVFLNLLVTGADIAEERASGRLRRLFIAPLAKWEIIVGKLLSRVAVGWIQAAYMLVLGVFVFQIRWARHTGVFFWFLTVFALASASLGIWLGTVFKDPDKCRTAAIWTAILLSPLGGLWWPLEVVGPTMRKIGYLVPTGWAMESVNAMLAFDAGAGEVAPFALAFAALAAVSLIFAARGLRP